MARHVRERGERRHRVVEVSLAEVAQHELGVRSADPREDRPCHHPVGTKRPRVVHFVQSEWDEQELALEIVASHGPDLVGRRRCTEDERFHRVGACGSSAGVASGPSAAPFAVPSAAARDSARDSAWDSAKARMVSTKASKSEVFISTTAFMSGR